VAILHLTSIPKPFAGSVANPPFSAAHASGHNFLDQELEVFGIPPEAVLIIQRPAFL
jgi:hypothetical protein